MQKRKWLKTSLIVLAIAFVGIQFVPVDRENPPVTGEVTAPAQVKALLKRSCYDCHSNETRWPWYAYVAPVSWLVAEDVEEGREHLNFSEWDKLSPSRQARLKEEIAEEVAEGEMPLSNYLITHPDAELSDADKALLYSWTGPPEEGGEDDDHDDHEGHEHGR